MVVSHDRHHLSPIAIDDCAHGCQLVRQATSVNNIKYAGSVGTLAFLLGGRRHGKFEQYDLFCRF